MMDNKFEQLQKLVGMKEAGHLTEEEFEQFKAKLLEDDKDEKGEGEAEAPSSDVVEDETPNVWANDPLVNPSEEVGEKNGTPLWLILVLAVLIGGCLCVWSMLRNGTDNGYSYDSTETLSDYTADESGETESTSESESASEKSEPASEPKEEPKPEKQKKPDLELNDYKAHIDEAGYVYIEGSVTNNTSEDYSFVEIEFNLYDDDNAQVGTAMDGTSNLEAGGTWKFKAISICEADNVSTYKPVNLQGMKY